MKKEYSKPIVVFESFSMSTNIAGDCEHKTNLPSPGTSFGCGYPIRGGVVFMSETSGCTYTEGGAENGSYNGICYQVPNENSNLFNS